MKQKISKNKLTPSLRHPVKLGKKMLEIFNLFIWWWWWGKWKLNWVTRGASKIIFNPKVMERLLLKEIIEIEFTFVLIILQMNLSPFK